MLQLFLKQTESLKKHLRPLLHQSRDKSILSLQNTLIITLQDLWPQIHKNTHGNLMKLWLRMIMSLPYSRSLRGTQKRKTKAFFTSLIVGLMRWLTFLAYSFFQVTKKCNYLTSLTLDLMSGPTLIEVPIITYSIWPLKLMILCTGISRWTNKPIMTCQLQ